MRKYKKIRVPYLKKKNNIFKAYQIGEQHFSASPCKKGQRLPFENLLCIVYYISITSR